MMGGFVFSSTMLCRLVFILSVAHFISIRGLILVRATGASQENVCQPNDIEDPTCSPPPTNDDDDGDDAPEPPPPPADCTIVMAPSTIPDSGWGVFSLVERKRGTPVAPADVVIQVTDVNPAHADGMRLMLHNYLWSAEETGGFYEGRHVMSVLPGIGMLANGLDDNKHNVLPFVPSYDEGGATRGESPGAGAFSHYHNYTFFAQKPIPAGGEIFVKYGPNWFNERRERLKGGEEVVGTARAAAPPSRSLDELRKHGRCLDNLRAGKSKIPHAGRGAFARRNLPAGSIVAPVPVLPITKRETLDMLREKETTGGLVRTKQLLLNYCFGHANSSVLFYPYSPAVNLINNGTPKQANVRLRWSTSKELHATGQEWFNKPLPEWKEEAQSASGLLLELVALRDIRQGEEIKLDYGEDWGKAWLRHIQAWEQPEDAEMYAPSYVQDDVARALRTESEAREHPYPDNVFTSCFYRYADHKELAEKRAKKKKKEGAGAAAGGDDDDAVTTFRWNMTRGIFELRNLRPCSVLQRQHRDAKAGGTTFTVRIRNRYGLAAEERLPKGAMHIVTGVPRTAIRFSDKIYTTDQHLEGAFRHEIGIPDDVFPEKWKDLQ